MRLRPQSSELIALASASLKIIGFGCQGSLRASASSELSAHRIGFGCECSFRLDPSRSSASVVNTLRAKEQKGRYQENNQESRDSEKQTVVSGQTKCSQGKDLFFN